MESGDHHVFGPWTTIDRIGEGAFGITWKCRHVHDPERIAAVKALREELHDHAVYRARFQAECDLLSALGNRPHPHLAAFDGADSDAGGPTWIALEFIDGRDLEACLDDGRHPFDWPLGPSPRDRYQLGILVGRAIASATAYTHAQGIVHRDIKPSNILMSNHGRIVLVDFGIGRDARVERLTARQAPSPHTAAFAAPEVLVGDKIDDAWLNRLDVYSLGVVLHEILSGDVAHIPYVLDARGEAQPRPRNAPLDLPAGFPEALANLVHEMTALQPWGRPDMATVHARLHTLADEMPRSAKSRASSRAVRPTEATERSGPPVRTDATSTTPARRPPPVTPTRRDTWRPQQKEDTAKESLLRFFQPDRPLPGMPRHRAKPPPEPVAQSASGPSALVLGAGLVCTLLIVGVAYLTVRPDVCGDGRVSGEELCDDGNRLDGDGCDFLCRIERCGDGALQGAEACDDGNRQRGDGCSPRCQIEQPPPGCGNGTLDPDETCDDGNTVAGDGCNVLCRTETASKDELSVCGNGVIEPGEACDDGNALDGDGCSAICVLEARFPPQSDAELSSWAANAEGPDLAMLYDHLTTDPAWLGAFGGQPVREVVAASIRVDVLPDSLSVQTAEAVAPLLPRRGHAVNCHDARAWLAWTGGGLGIRDDVNAFYKRWCEICTIRHPDLTVPRNECRRRKTDGYHEVQGLCRHVDNTPYLPDCALPATNP